MSRLKSKYRKRVTSDYMSSNSSFADDNSENLHLAQVVENRGGNLFLLKLILKSSSDSHPHVGTSIGEHNSKVTMETSCSSEFIAKLPNKFNKCIWIKKNDFVMVTSFEEESDSTKGAYVGGYEISQILKAADIKAMKSSGVWPILESDTTTTEKSSSKSSSYMQDYEEMGKHDSLSDQEFEEDNDVDGAEKEKELAVVER
eukprot:gene32985-42678_t